MKKLLTTSLLTLLSLASIFAQNEKYVEAMTSSIALLDKVDKAKNDPVELQGIANRFERIATAETKEWLPRYYAAYCYTLMGLSGNSIVEKDKYLDKADGLIKESENLVGKPSDEILIMKAYAAQIRLAADGMNRWQKYGALFAENIEAAKAVNADNPRIYYLEGSSLLFTPEEYGGGKKAAKPFLEKAVAKFATFKPQSSISPQWGKMEAEWMLSQTN
ncbi:hypothetical protein L0657_16605 [Dyadobacter sp. CY345]|uniref:hypothetical protein n=1 Tax=Dyadobacter sp. CY345 TaxID=2909335 RepID=UPI001F3ABE11|nr:hypothetical protein [Dyadobacter sp. CY345]MCF2445587.1 hypothetical protein [Dyadobacter sp. CY345]